MAYKNIIFRIEDSIALITINRPDQLNALNSTTIEEIEIAFQQVYDDSKIKAVILTGAGEKAFVAGADVKEFSSLNEMNARSFSEKGQEVFSMIEKCHKPVIAAINGFALGGGCELAMACHLRISTPNAKFGQPEANLGLIPGYGGTQRLTQLIGKSKALELMMTADMISAEEALRLGLVNYLVNDHEALLEKSKEILNKIMNKAPLAIGLIIDCVNALYSDEENGYQTEANAFAALTKSEDFIEGSAAFLEKRAANFIGQ